MTIIAPTDFSAKAISSETIEMKCSVPDGAAQFDWQYTTSSSPENNDWITIKTTNEYGLEIIP